MENKTRKQLMTMKNIIGIGLALAKSFFLAITQVAWGIVSIFALNAVLVWQHETKRADITLISPLFLKLETFIGTHIMLFVWIFFALIAYFEIKEVITK